MCCELMCTTAGLTLPQRSSWSLGLPSELCLLLQVLPGSVPQLTAGGLGRWAGRRARSLPIVNAASGESWLDPTASPAHVAEVVPTDVPPDVFTCPRGTRTHDCRRLLIVPASQCVNCFRLLWWVVLSATVPSGHRRQWDKNKSSTRSRQEGRAQLRSRVRGKSDPQFETVWRRRRLMKPRAGIFPRRGGKKGA